MPGWMNHNLESQLPVEISAASDMQMIPVNGRKWKELKSLLMEVKEENVKAGLKLNIQKNKIMASNAVTSWQIDGENVKNSVGFHLLMIQNQCGQWLQPWN